MSRGDGSLVLAAAGARPEVMPADLDLPAVGAWFWIKEPESNKAPRLGCVTHVGSNYGELTEAGNRHGWTTRVHFEEWVQCCTPEPDAERLIAGEVERCRAEVNRLMGEVKAIAGRLAVSAGTLSAGSGGAEAGALALRGSGQPIEDYKTALIRAKDETLPELFKAIAATNEELGAWMSASQIPLRAEAERLKPAIKAIERRIFSVELYAGLVEEVEQIAHGEPAPIATPLHLLQRRAYMDEECLARYRVGGMSFAQIPDFDAWLAEPENRDRILPFPRSIIAFQVRRHQREIDTPSLRKFIQMMEGLKLDKLTFLYIRNGEQLFRLTTGIEFGETLFPDLAQVDLGGEQIYARVSAGRVDRLITRGEFEERLAEEEKANARAGAADPADRWRFLPHTNVRQEFVPYSPESVYYDDIAARVHEEMERHNRLVLVLQGLLDRSPVLHPHPPWQLWTPEGFEQALRLVYDQSRALSPGDAPDFEAYRSRLNASLATGSVTVGQQEAWEKLMAARENARLANDWRARGSSYRHTRFRPDGDPGPGILAKVSRWVRTGRATFEWDRVRRREAWRGRFGAGVRPGGLIRSTVTIEISQLLNVSAYTPGDFRIFYDDPRTRADYLQWAPLLLEAEEYHAGNRELGAAEEP